MPRSKNRQALLFKSLIHHKANQAHPNDRSSRGDHPIWVEVRLRSLGSFRLGTDDVPRWLWPPRLAARTTSDTRPGRRHKAQNKQPPMFGIPILLGGEGATAPLASQLRPPR